MPTTSRLRSAKANDDDAPDVLDDEDADEDEQRGAAQEGDTGTAGKPRSARAGVRGAVVSMVIAVIQTSLIAWFGFTLSGRLELALKERKATVDAAKAMGELIVSLREEQTVDADRSLMLQLAMYGEDAIGPMVIMAMTPGNYGPDIPIFGLKRLGITYRDSTCKALVAGHDSDAWIQDPVRRPLLDDLLKEMKCETSCARWDWRCFFSRQDLPAPSTAPR
jgi:hypothetical protein